MGQWEHSKRGLGQGRLWAVEGHGKRGQGGRRGWYAMRATDGGWRGCAFDTARVRPHCVYSATCRIN
eukprot:1054209-Prymnesium_polylepis.1